MERISLFTFSRSGFGRTQTVQKTQILQVAVALAGLRLAVSFFNRLWVKSCVAAVMGGSGAAVLAVGCWLLAFGYWLLAISC